MPFCFRKANIEVLVLTKSAVFSSVLVVGENPLICVIFYDRRLISVPISPFFAQPILRSKGPRPFTKVEAKISCFYPICIGLKSLVFFNIIVNKEKKAKYFDFDCLKKFNYQFFLYCAIFWPISTKIQAQNSIVELKHPRV